jgi:arylsulfatase A
MPTLAHLADAPLPEHRIIDGHNITPLLKQGAGGKSEYDQFFYWSKKRIEGMRQGHMKLRIAWDKKKKMRKKPELYDLKNDISEKNNLAEQRPEVLAHMTKMMLEAEKEQLEHSKR